MQLTKNVLLTDTIDDIPADVGAGIFVTVTGAIGTSGAYAYGVMPMHQHDGDRSPVQVFGIVPVVAGAAISVGALLQVGTDGKAITRTGTNPIVGLALSESTTAEELIMARIPY